MCSVKVLIRRNGDFQLQIQKQGRGGDKTSHMLSPPILKVGSMSPCPLYDRRPFGKEHGACFILVRSEHAVDRSRYTVVNASRLLVRFASSAKFFPSHLIRFIWGHCTHSRNCRVLTLLRRRPEATSVLLIVVGRIAVESDRGRKHGVTVT